MSVFDRPSAPPAHPSTRPPRRAGIDPQASSVQVWHFPGQKLRLGGDALGADPTYLLYLPSRSRGELRRIDFGAWPRAATLPPTIFPRIGPQASAAHSWHFPGQKLRLGGDALGADPTYLLYLPSRSRGGLRRIDFGAWPRAATSNHICLMEVGGSHRTYHESRVTYRVVLVRINSQKAAGNSLRHLG